MSEDLKLALELAAVASEIALNFLGRSGEFQVKADGSPVGAVDLAIERALIEVLSRQRPADGVLSEEAGAVADGNRRWLIDPLDGTSLFRDGLDGWGTMIALQRAGVSELAVITRPLQGHWWWAVRGEGSYVGDLGRTPGDSRRLAVSGVSEVERARVSAWQPLPVPEVDRLRALPGWVEPSADVFLELAAGQLDAVVSLGGLVWDHAPAVLLVEEAGGLYRDRRGGGRQLDAQGGVYANSMLSEGIGGLVGWF